jgi:hypothetical protein
VTYAAYRGQKRGLDMQQRALEDERQERLQEPSRRRRRVMNQALDDVAFNRQLLAAPWALGVKPPQLRQAGLDGAALEIGAMPPEVAEAVNAARIAVDQYNRLAVDATMTVGSQVMPDPQSPARLLDQLRPRVSEALRDVLVQLENMRAAIDRPQGSGARWHD